MDTVHIAIAPLNRPEDKHWITIHHPMTLKRLLGIVSGILKFEVYGLFINKRKLIDIHEISNNDLVYAADSMSPEQSVFELNLAETEDTFDARGLGPIESEGLKAVIVGERFSGKTSFIMRYIHNIYVKKYTPTCIAAEYCTVLQLNDMDHPVSIIDTTDTFLRDYDCDWLVDRELVIVAINIEQVQRWKPIMLNYQALIKRINVSLVFIMITKIDLLERLKPERRRLVAGHIKELEVFADTNSMILFKSSAKTNKRVSTPFLVALKRLHSFKLQNSARITGFMEVYYKKPFLFRVLDRFFKWYQSENPQAEPNR